MIARISTCLLLLSIFTSITGCESRPSTADLERERIAREQAEQEKIAAQQRADAERQRREEEAAKHDSEKSRLWMYVFAVAVVAVVLLFVGTAMGSAARKHAEREIAKHDNGPSAST